MSLIVVIVVAVILYVVVIVFVFVFVNYSVVEYMSPCRRAWVNQRGGGKFGCGVNPVLNARDWGGYELPRV